MKFNDYEALNLTTIIRHLNSTTAAHLVNDLFSFQPDELLTTADYHLHVAGHFLAHIDQTQRFYNPTQSSLQLLRHTTEAMWSAEEPSGTADRRKSLKM